MATSYEYFKEDIKKYILKKFPDDNTTILDVGAGEGTYYNLLGNKYHNMTAVEAFKPNIEKYKLREKYSDVIWNEIQNIEYDWFNLIIFGDVIEHLSENDAQVELRYAYDHCEEMIVAVPYQYPQGEIDGNKYEIHIQDDLTPEIMKERYPFLKLLFGNKEYGYYIKANKEEGDEENGERSNEQQA